MYIDTDLLSYCWKYRLLGNDLKATNGESVEVSDCGLFDRKHGSRFFNAKLRIGSTLYVGNVLIVNISSDFFGSFKNYERESKNIILVVCNVFTQQCIDANGNVIPTIEVEIPEKVDRNVRALMDEGGEALCHSHINEYTPRLAMHAWLASMQTEFLERETEYLKSYYYDCGKDLEETFFASLLRAYGFGTNKVTMDLLARNTSLEAMEKCRDDLFQVEAILFGQAGLLEIKPEVQCAVPEKYFDAAMKDGYFPKLRNEWLYLAHKYKMNHSISKLCWSPYGRGGIHYPHVYISMLANWWYCRKASAKAAMNVETADEAMQMLDSHVTPYWMNHFMFGSLSDKHEKFLTRNRRLWIVTTSLIPFMFFWGRENQEEELCDRAFDLWEQLKSFSTPETNHFKKYGISIPTAGDSTALSYLRNEYCKTKDCLRCRFGFHFITNH